MAPASIRVAEAQEVVTVDLDTKSQHKLQYYLRIAKAYGFKPKLIRETRNGYHIIYWIPAREFEGLDWFKARRYKKHIMKCLIRLEKAQHMYNVGFSEMKHYILRLILGDDIARILMDMKRRGKLPQQVLFREYVKLWLRKK